MQSATVRHRPVNTLSSDPGTGKENQSRVDRSDLKGRPRLKLNLGSAVSPVLSGSVWLLIFSFYALLLLYIHVTSFKYPEPVTVAVSKPGQFVEERARKHLDDLTVFGSRTVGSIANEKLAVEYLIEEIEAIRRDMNSAVHNLEVDVQRVSGTFSLDFLGQFTSYYDNVNNIVVRLSPKHGSEHSLLINCHYDTSMNTTGASDDTVSCCVMLEVLRVMSRNTDAFLHSVTFIFNGAEENVLQASHGFITQHPWAKEIRAFVNLEACGAGGKQMLFQSGPEHPWLVSAYANNAPHPFASIVGQELFQSGLIPSDTDYRIYRDYGGLPGLDLAYIYNGYVYHTVFDKPEMIPLGSIQQAGENLLAVVIAIVDSPLLADPAEYRHGRVVFFDLLGHFMIVYPLRIGTIINSITVAVVMAWIGNKLFRRGSGYRGLSYLKHLALAAIVFLVSVVFAAICITAIAFALDFSGHAMSWYSNSWVVFGVYLAPAAGSIIVVCSVAKKVFYKDKNYRVWDVEEIYFDFALLLNAILLAVLTYNELCSAVMTLLPVLFPTVIRLGATQLFRLSPEEHQRTFITVYLTSLLIPNLLFIWFAYTMLQMFIPIMGRSGDAAIPDLIVGFICLFGAVTVLMWQLGLVFATRSMRWIIAGLLAVFIASVLAVTQTPIGFPYRADVSNPTRQRLIIHHLERNFRNIDGDVIHTDSGILVIPFDRNSDRYISTLPAMKDAKQGSCHEELPYCGWPYYLPMIEFMHMKSLKYTTASTLDDLIKPKLTLLNHTVHESNVHRLQLSIEGPNHVNIYLSPKPGVHLIGWSVGDGYPQPTAMPSYVARPHYFIFYSYGTKPDQPFQLSLELQPEPEMTSSGLIDIALGGHYLNVDGTPYLTSDLDEFVGSLPDWTTSLAWPVTYDTWIV